jgi:glycine dehydrogenase subunit 1
MRYLPLTPEDRSEMLARIGAAGIDELFADIPADKRLDKLPDLPLTKSEIEVEREVGRLAASVDHLIQRSEFLTSYTPYQPEIAQGTLHYLFEFQTQVAMLTGMEVANSSMYDGSTATAEAVLMAHRITKRKKAVIAGNLHPHYRETVDTVSRMSEHVTVTLPRAPEGERDIVSMIDNETSCVVVQTPDYYGHLHDLRPIAEKAHAVGALLIAVFTEAVSLGLVTPPGEMGADIVVGEGQSFGNALSFGGPYVGLFATRQKYVRQMPGRLVGETVDAEGKRGFVLTLSTREQHIRREKATSNICTNSGLCVLAFTIHLSLLGEAGLRRLARINHANAVKLADMLSEVPGVEVLNKTFFNEFTLRLPGEASHVVHQLSRKGVHGGVAASALEWEPPELRNLIIVASSEVNTDEDRAAYVKALKEVLR